MARPCPPAPEHLATIPGGEACWARAFDIFGQMIGLARKGGEGGDVHLFLAHELLRVRLEGAQDARAQTLPVAIDVAPASLPPPDAEPGDTTDVDRETRP